MAPVRTLLVALVLGVGASLLPAAKGSSASERVSCTRVISAVNRSISRAPMRDPDISDIAQRLGTSSLWVERCMLMYGRRPKRPGMESGASIEAEIERMESEEPEERMAEDAGEPKGTPTAERVRRRIPATPTPHIRDAL